jgi:hypothetical protein
MIVEFTREFANATGRRQAESCLRRVTLLQQF